MNLEQEFKKLFSLRLPESHKGDYGRIFILAGSQGMSGACYLAGMAALRSGCGLVTVGVVQSLLLPLSRRMTEVVMKGLPETKEGTLSLRAYQSASRFLKKQDVLAIGPGLSQNPETQTVVRKIVLASHVPVVIDADGLNAFAQNASLFRKVNAPVILTPHSGEFVRLFGGGAPKTPGERKRRTLEAAKKFKCIILLKGHHTVVASPTGDLYVNTTGNPGMATGGSGDVLTGMIAALLGQKIKPFSAACLGAYLHGLAGDFAARKKGQISLIASDIIDSLPLAFRKVNQK